MRPDRAITIQGGLWRDGVRHRAVTLRPLAGEAQRALLDAHVADLPAQRATAVLAATVVAIGDIDPVTAEDVRSLPVGDRDQLLLHARRDLRGDLLACTFACGAEGCGALLELDLDVAQLLASVPRDERPVEAAGETERGLRVRVRAATGADQERAAQLARTDPAAAVDSLLDGCVIEPRSEAVDASTLGDEGRALAQRLLAELDPAAELLLGGPCPDCGADVSAALDPITHVWAELEEDRAILEHQIHVLALHYHWSEAEIVGLAPARRRRYLARLDQELLAR